MCPAAFRLRPCRSAGQEAGANLGRGQSRPVGAVPCRARQAVTALCSQPGQGQHSASGKPDRGWSAGGGSLQPHQPFIPQGSARMEWNCSRHVNRIILPGLFHVIPLQVSKTPISGQVGESSLPGPRFRHRNPGKAGGRQAPAVSFSSHLSPLRTKSRVSEIGELATTQTTPYVPQAPAAGSARLRRSWVTRPRLCWHWLVARSRGSRFSAALWSVTWAHAIPGCFLKQRPSMMPSIVQTHH